MAQPTLHSNGEEPRPGGSSRFKTEKAEKAASKRILKQCQKRRVQIMKTPDKSILFTMQCMKIELQLVFVTVTCSLFYLKKKKKKNMIISQHAQPGLGYCIVATCHRYDRYICVKIFAGWVTYSWYQQLAPTGKKGYMG